MKRFVSLRVAASLVVLFAFVGVLSHHTAKAQSVCTAPVPLYRFIVNNTNLGTLLTTNYQEGVNLNYAYYPFPNGEGKIVVPPGQGFTLVPGQGLQPLYRYRIVQGSRTYYGYFNGFAYGSGYYYEGIVGYTLPGFGQYGGVPLNAYYSQSKGYFYTSGYETPIGYPYSYGWANHGTPAYLPDGAAYCWNPPCSPDPQAAQQCEDNGGSYDYTTCTCHYIPPDPCRGGGELGGDKGGDKGGNERPPMPCRSVEP